MGLAMRASLESVVGKSMVNPGGFSPKNRGDFKSGRTQQNIEGLKRRVKLSQLVARSVALKRDGEEFRGLCPFHKETTASFYVNDAKGRYYCFGCEASGDALEWLMQSESVDFKTALSLLRERAGQVEMPDDYAPAPIPAAVQREKSETETAWLMRAWAEASSISGSLAASYLSARGIDPRRIPVKAFSYLRFETSSLHKETGKRFAAMLGYIANGAGELIGLHRTYLECRTVHDGAVRACKAPVQPAKKMFGRFGGGAIPLCAPASRLLLAEGIETALSVHQATKLPVWAALSLGNLSAVELPVCVKEVVLCADSDSKDEQRFEAALSKAVVLHGLLGRKVLIARAKAGCDFNDMLMERA